MAPYLRGIREGVRGWRIQPGSRMAVSLIVSALMALAACGSQAAEVPASSAAAASEPVTEQVATPEPSPLTPQQRHQLQRQVPRRKCRSSPERVTM